MRVLLVQPPIEDFYTTPIRLYPLGLLYAARVLTLLDAEVRVLDCLTPLKKRQLPFPQEFAYLKTAFDADPLLFKHYHRFGLDDTAVAEVVDDCDPDLVGISAQFTAYYQSVDALARLIKRRRRTPIFIGGNHATVMATEIRKRTPAVDHVLEGPAETCLPPFIAGLLPGRAADPAPVDWRAIQPAHELVPGGRYRIGRRNYISLSASRGCPHRCDFCSVHRMFGHRISYRKADDVLTEMRRAYLENGVRLFNFEDDNIAADRKWFEHFLESVLADEVLKEIELTAMNGVGYTHLDPPILERMWAAGFRRLNLSCVTRDARLRERYHRPSGKTGIDGVIADAKRLGFMVTVYVIIGLPGQTRDEVRASIDHLLDQDVLVGPSIFYIPPGSALYDRLDLPPGIRDNWNLYRSSAFAVETRDLSRETLLALFTYTRKRNLAAGKRAQ